MGNLWWKYWGSGSWGFCASLEPACTPRPVPACVSQRHGSLQGQGWGMAAPFSLRPKASCPSPGEEAPLHRYFSAGGFALKLFLKLPGQSPP